MPTAKKRTVPARNKTGAKSDTRFKKGPDARRGRGPKKGAPNAGRPPLELVQKCRDASLKTVLPKILRYLNSNGHGPDDAGWRWAADVILDRGWGKVTTPVEIRDPLSDEERLARAIQLLEIARERAHTEER